MEESKPKSIKTTGIIIIVFSFFIIFSNLSGMLAGKIFEDIGESNDKSFNIISLILKNYTEMCVFMIVVGLFYLVGGIFILKYKLWAKKLIIIVSILLIAIIWSLMILMAISIGQSANLIFFSIAFVFNAIFWSTPIVLLIRFLNKERIKSHFI